MADSATTRLTPRSRASASSSTAEVPTARGWRNRAVTPSRKGATVSGRDGSPSTTSTPAGRPAASGLRVMARTSAPWATSTSTRGRPMVPVAPVTTSMASPSICTGTASPGKLSSVIQKIWRSYHMILLPTTSPDAQRRRRRSTTAIKEALRELSIQLSLLNHRVGAQVDLRDVDLDRNAELYRLYAGMSTAMDQLCAGYADTELELLADFLHRTATAGQDATDQLAGDRGTRPPAAAAS